MLMVKSDAYGCGAERVARATADLVDGFGVATVEEGVRLREAGISAPVLVLVCPPREIETAITYGLSIGVHCFEQLSALDTLIRQNRISPDEARIHIKADTGMHRLGFSPAEICALPDMLSKMGVHPEGIYSHLRARSYEQKTEFTACVSQLKASFEQITAHLAASPNLLVKSMQFDMVRVGIAAYRGAMTVKSEVIAARRVNAGEHISYGNFKAEHDVNTAIVFGGYGDGVARERPSGAVIRGRMCKPLGRVCMDMFAVDTGEFLADIGEEVTLFSSDIAHDVARQRKTIDYTVMTSWHGRVERRYVDKERGKKDSPR